jgi:hypothetical protein
MSFPKHEIIIGKDGMVQIESLEHSDECYKLNEVARALGKIISEEEKEHTPVYHDVHQRSN